MKSITIEEAVTVIQNGLLNDPGYRIGWTANIAMAFKDEMERSGVHSPNENNHSILVTRDMLHKIANTAAEDFINLLTKKYEGK